MNQQPQTEINNSTMKPTSTNPPNESIQTNMTNNTLNQDPMKMDTSTPTVTTTNIASIAAPINVHPPSLTSIPFNSTFAPPAAAAVAVAALPVNPSNTVNIVHTINPVNSVNTVNSVPLSNTDDESDSSGSHDEDEMMVTDHRDSNDDSKKRRLSELQCTELKYARDLQGNTNKDIHRQTYIYSFQLTNHYSVGRLNVDIVCMCAIF
jgi:hypothetical protein